MSARLPLPALPALTLTLLQGCSDVPDLSPPNEPPTAEDDNATILQDQVVNLFVTSNDVDIDGDVLTVELTSTPANGTAEVLDDGATVRYTPNRLFAGSDGFGYRITDTAGFQSEASVTIDVEPRELQVVFEARDDAGVGRLYVIDSRTPDSLIDLTASLAADEQLRSWVYDRFERRVLITTDANRLLAISLGDTDAIETFELVVADTETLDPGVDIVELRRAVYTVDNRWLRTLTFNTDMTRQSFDQGWTNSTMELAFLSPTGTAAVMLGGLGSPRNAAIYLATVSANAPIAVVETPSATAQPRARLLAGQTEMVWLLEEPGDPQRGGFDCAMPPEQRLSALSWTSLTDPANSTDLNAASGLLTAPASVISYAVANGATAALIAGCPAGAADTRLVEVPYADPATARVLATISSPLHALDYAPGGTTAVYSIEDGDALVPVRLEIAESAVEATDFAAQAPGYAPFDTGEDLIAPLSQFSSDGRRWLFVGPASGSPRELSWVEIETLAAASLTLPFDAGEPLSDGYHAFVSSANGDGTSTIALVDLDEPVVTPVIVPGVLVDAQGALALPTARLAPVPASES